MAEKRKPEGRGLEKGSCLSARLADSISNNPKGALGQKNHPREEAHGRMGTQVHDPSAIMVSPVSLGEWWILKVLWRDE